MQHRNHESNAWLITHLNSLLDHTKSGAALWEKKCHGKGEIAVLHSTVLNNQAEAVEYRDYLTKKGVICDVTASGSNYIIVVPVAKQTMKKSRFNVAHTDVPDQTAIDKITALLNHATPESYGKWSVSADHLGQRILICITKNSADNNDAELLKIIDAILAEGAFSEESRRSIRHHFLDNLYEEKHEHYYIFTIIDLAYMQQIETIRSLS